MARINIEECWWSDPRRSKLIRLLGGDEERADGAVIKMWRTAQEFWKRDHQLVPRRVFEALQSASELIEAGLADDRGDYIYVRGSSEYLEWVKDKTEAGKLGGLKSAQARREKYGSAQPKSRSTVEAASNQPEAPEPSGSVSGSNTNTNTYVIEAESLLKVWNQNRGSLPEAKELSKTRKTSALARLREKPDLSYWETVVKKLAGSPFCRGETGGTWRANFDFLLRPDTHVKAIEGLYDKTSPHSEINTTPINIEEML